MQIHTIIDIICVVSCQGPTIQSIALAATKTGVNASDIKEIASMGNYGRSHNHVAEQMTLRFCKSDSITLPEPYWVEAPVLVKNQEGWSVKDKEVGLLLPHEWFSWLEGHEVAAGFSKLASFWSEHPPEDPKLVGNPISDDSLFHIIFGEVMQLFLSKPLLATCCWYHAISGRQEPLPTHAPSWGWRCLPIF